MVEDKNIGGKEVQAIQGSFIWILKSPRIKTRVMSKKVAVSQEQKLF